MQGEKGTDKILVLCLSNRFDKWQEIQNDSNVKWLLIILAGQVWVTEIPMRREKRERPKLTYLDRKPALQPGNLFLNDTEHKSLWITDPFVTLNVGLFRKSPNRCQENCRTKGRFTKYFFSARILQIITIDQEQVKPMMQVFQVKKNSK